MQQNEMSTATGSLVNGIKVTRGLWRGCQRRDDAIKTGTDSTADDPNSVVTVIATNGKTGKESQISYTNCKVVGNGSFGVVYAAKMSGELIARFGDTRCNRADTLATKREDGSEEPESEIAIKKVLQDKRFKVGVGIGMRRE